MVQFQFRFGHPLEILCNHSRKFSRGVKTVVMFRAVMVRINCKASPEDRTLWNTV